MKKVVNLISLVLSYYSFSAGATTLSKAEAEALYVNEASSNHSFVGRWVLMGMAGTALDYDGLHSTHFESFSVLQIGATDFSHYLRNANQFNYGIFNKDYEDSEFGSLYHESGKVTVDENGLRFSSSSPLISNEGKATGFWSFESAIRSLAEKNRLNYECRLLKNRFHFWMDSLICKVQTGEYYFYRRTRLSGDFSQERGRELYDLDQDSKLSAKELLGGWMLIASTQLNRFRIDGLIQSVISSGGFTLQKTFFVSQVEELNPITARVTVAPLQIQSYPNVQFAPSLLVQTTTLKPEKSEVVEVADITCRLISVFLACENNDHQIEIYRRTEILNGRVKH